MSFPYPYLFAHWKIPGGTRNSELGTGTSHSECPVELAVPY